MEANLRVLNRLFRSTTSQKEALFYSKLAILELCGWIEESMDDVIFRCANRVLRSDKSKKFVATQVIKRTYGFEYDAHFRAMLIKVIGLANVERVEKRVDQAKYARLTATLGVLRDVRNNEAHTHLKGVTKAINAPSVTANQFEDVYGGLLDYDAALRRMGL